MDPSPSLGAYEVAFYSQRPARYMHVGLSTFSIPSGYQTKARTTYIYSTTLSQEQHYPQSSSFQATILCQKDIYVRPDQLLCLVLLFRPRLDIIDIYAGIFSTKLKMRAQDSYFPIFQSPEDMPNLQGRTAIVTGGACGIGYVHLSILSFSFGISF